MKKYIEVERSHARTIQEGYRCAACWNPLIVSFDKGGTFIECVTEDCRLPGLVSAHWVDRQMSQNLAEAATARKVLKDSIEWLNTGLEKKLSKEQNLKLLG